MIQTLNLRSDLAQLSDADLAKRLDDAWRSYDAATNSGGWVRRNLWRGPIRHPRAYRFFAWLRNSDGSFGTMLLALALSHKSGEGVLRRSDPSADLQLTLCEIQDLVDEAERRVAKRKATS